MNDGQSNTDNDQQRWENVYKGSSLEELPWEENQPSAELVALIESGIVEKGPVLDVCCGSANNAIYLAERGFECYGIDISLTAISYAREKAANKGVNCQLTQGNALQIPYPDSTFTLVFDRGCFHSISPANRQTYILGVHRVMRLSGKYQLICFRIKDHKYGPPYAFSPKDIRQYFSRLFKIHHIKELTQDIDNSRGYFLSALMEKE